MKKIRLILAGLFMMMTSVAFAQNINVTGTVTDASTGETIIGAAVVLNGDNTVYAYTDAFGEYSLQVPSDGVLRVEFTGYKTVEIPVNGKTVIDIQLDIAAEMLEDVVVVGYGSARKISSVVGSASTVKKQVMMNRPSANAGDALQGQVSGLQVFTSSGEPTEQSSMRLRGVNSISAGTTPLIVLDGAPVSQAVFSALNSNDIESVVVMKDASSTAIYGSRAANGVIYITTKKGKSGEKPVVNLRGNYGISTVVDHKMDLMNSEEWFTFNETYNPYFWMTPSMQLSREMGIDTDWLKYYFKETAPVWSADISVSGSSEKSDYYFSLGTFSQEGTLPNSEVQRYTFRMNLNTRATDWLKLGASLNLTYQNYDTAGFTNVGNSYFNPVNAVNWTPTYISPYEILYDADGNPYVSDIEKDFFVETEAYYNTFYLQDLQPSNQNQARLMGTTYIELNPVKGLTLRAQQNLEAIDYRGSSYVKPEGPFAPDQQTTFDTQRSESFSRSYKFTFTNTIEYAFDVKKNNFNILLGQESIYNEDHSFSVSEGGFYDWRLNMLGQGNHTWGTGSISDYWLTPPGESRSEVSYNSYFARVSYNYGEKYYVDASWRMDGSSLFGIDHQYANFYSIGAMWDLKRESFLQSASWIQDLRLKASYGTTGNSSIDNYLSQSYVAAYGPTYNGQIAWGIGTPPNPDLTWETVENLNIGVSARLWNFLNVTAEFYNKVTHDLLMSIPYSYTTGYTAGWGNAGDMLNRGVDLDLGFDVIQTQNLYFNITANFNYNYNEILELFAGRDEYTIANTGLSLQKGYPYGEFFIPRSAGVDPLDGMQMWYDDKGNITKEFSEEFAVMTGKQRYAPWSGGIQFNFQYKGLYIGADFSWVLDKWSLNNDRYFLTNPLFVLNNANGSTDLLRAWKQPGDITDVPSIESVRQFDDTLLENASFLRLKNLQIGYEFPKKWMERTGFISGFRIYAIARNLFTITGYTGYDPEVDSNLQMGVYPNSRQFTVGAEFTF